METTQQNTTILLFEPQLWQQMATKQNKTQQVAALYATLRDRALADDRHFVYGYVSAGLLTIDSLKHKLNEFNVWLQDQAIRINGDRDYRRHFDAWLKKKSETQNVVYQNKKRVTLPLPVDTPAGKFSKGGNRYDMHWLRNLRDEVRSMGG